MLSSLNQQVIRRFRCALVKFDVMNPYGEKHKSFKEFVPSTLVSDDLLIATVGVKGKLLTGKVHHTIGLVGQINIDVVNLCCKNDLIWF